MMRFILAFFLLTGVALAQSTPTGGGGSLTPLESGLSLTGGSLSGNLHLQDDILIQFGNTAAAPDFWTGYNATATAWQLSTTDGDGAGANSVIMYVDDGTDDLNLNAHQLIFTPGEFILSNNGTSQVIIGGGGTNRLFIGSEITTGVPIKMSVAGTNIYNSAGPVRIGTNSASTHGLAANTDAKAGGVFEVDGILYADSSVVMTGASGSVTTWTKATAVLTFAANPGDATKTATGILPLGANLDSVTTYVTTEATNCASVNIGNGVDVDIYGAAQALIVGTDTDATNYTATTSSPQITNAGDVVITSVGGAGNCFDGVWRVVVTYFLTTPPTS